MSETLNRFINLLPNELKRAFYASPRCYPPGRIMLGATTCVHEAMKAIVAKHLWNRGLRSITFEKPLNLPGGELIYIDVYEESSRIAVECIFKARLSDLREKAFKIRQADPNARIIAAIHDTRGWDAGRFLNLAHEVWVVCRDGQVLSAPEWADKRKMILKGAVEAERITLLLKCYLEVLDYLNECNYEKMSSYQETLRWINMFVNALLPSAPKIEVEYDRFADKTYDKNINYYTKILGYLKQEILAEIIGAINVIVGFYTAQALSLDENGVLHYNSDPNLMDWLGVSDDVEDSPEEVLRKVKVELGIVAEQLKRHASETGQSVKRQQFSLVKLYNLVAGGRKDIIRNRRFLEEIMNEIMEEARRLYPHKTLYQKEPSSSFTS